MILELVFEIFTDFLFVCTCKTSSPASELKVYMLYEIDPWFNFQLSLLLALAQLVRIRPWEQGWVGLVQPCTKH